MSLSTVTIVDNYGEKTQTAFRDGDTLEKVLNFLGMNTSNLDVFVNNETEPFSYELEDGDEITLMSRKQKSGADAA